MNLPNRLRDSAENNFVFQYKGKPIYDIRAGLKKGCDDAGIPYGRNVVNGFTLHDLRRTAKTYARKAGVDKNVGMIMFGYSNGNDMDLRSDIVDVSDLINAVDQIEAYLHNVDHCVDQGQKNSPRDESRNRLSY